jgi:hypothetical protein
MLAFLPTLKRPDREEKQANRQDQEMNVHE